MKSPLPLRLAVLFAGLLCSVDLLPAKDWWVSPTGSDRNPGTKEEPLQTLAIAQRKVRDARRLGDAAIATGAHIILRGGTYPVIEPLLFRPEDSGTEASPTVIEAAPGEHPVLSGGIAITSWRKATENIPGLPEAAKGKVWIADVPQFCGRPLEFRALWIGDTKATRARSPNNGAMARLKSWDRSRQIAGVPSELIASLDGDVSGVEMVVQQQWEIGILRIKAIQARGEIAELSFQDPESRLEFDHPWPQPILPPKGGGAFFLTNHVRFLDEPGEWFEDTRAGKILYWPRHDDELTQANVVAPALETLVQIAGTLDHPVAYLRFEGISFEHTTWMRPSASGHVPLQEGMYLTDAYSLSPKGTPDWHGLDNQAWVGRPPAAVEVSAANHLVFSGCRFEHLAMDGLDASRGTHDDLVEGCVFNDIGGNGIVLGEFSAEGVEAHLPYNPTDEREICSKERIANNLFTDCANEDWGCVGIGVGFARDVSIEHNELHDLSYTGISVGWGWTRTKNAARNHRIYANYIHHVATRMCDTAGIYTLSAQAGTEISENVVENITMTPYVDRPEHWFYLYLDEGSSFIRVHDNWCPEERFLKNANGPGNEWTNNGPMVSQEIKARAGLEKAFSERIHPRP